MNFFRNALAALLLMGVWGTQAKAASALNEFETELRTACKTKDLVLAKKLCDFEGVPQAFVDSNVYHDWQERFADDYPGTFKEIKFLTLDELRADPLSHTLLNFYRTRDMNGTLYGPNLTIVGFMRIIYETKDNVNTSQSSTWVNGKMTSSSSSKTKGELPETLPVGIAEDGSYRIVMTRVLKSADHP
jgi:hypothetical protein